MKIYCGSADDVHPYQRIQRSSVNRPAHPTDTSTGSSTIELPSVSRLGGRKKGGSFRERVSDSVKSNGCKSQSPSSSTSASPAAPSSAPGPAHPPSFPAGPKLPREIPGRKVGLVDFLMGYHALLQLTPSTSISNPLAQKRELHPTIGFAHMHAPAASHADHH